MEYEPGFAGEKPVLKESVIKNMGNNNILFCEKDVILADSKIVFNGNNSLIYLSSNKNEYKLNITIHNNQVCFWGRDNYINGTVNIILSEQKHIFIGSSNVFSFGVWMRNADPHLIYDLETKKRTNITQSIFIGDHVWIGQSVMILKGTLIGSGSIIGAMSLVAGNTISSNECWGGVAAKRLKTGVFWDEACVHNYTEQMTQKSEICNKDKYIYSKNMNRMTDFKSIDAQLSDMQTSMDKLDYLIKLVQIDEKDRFAIV